MDALNVMVSCTTCLIEQMDTGYNEFSPFFYHYWYRKIKLKKKIFKQKLLRHAYHTFSINNIKKEFIRNCFSNNKSVSIGQQNKNKISIIVLTIQFQILNRLANDPFCCLHPLLRGYGQNWINIGVKSLDKWTCM